MKPHVARFRLLDVKDLLPAGSIDLAAGLLLSMHSLEGEKRTETAALMTALVTGKDRKYGKEKFKGKKKEVFQPSSGGEKRDGRLDSQDDD